MARVVHGSQQFPHGFRKELLLPERPPQRAGNSQSIRSSADLNASVLRTDGAVLLECRQNALCDRLDQPRRGGQSDCITNPPQEQNVQKHQRDYPQQPAASSCSVHNVSAGGCLQHAGRDHQHQAGSQIDEPKLGGQRLFTELVLLAAAGSSRRTAIEARGWHPLASILLGLEPTVWLS